MASVSAWFKKGFLSMTYARPATYERPSAYDEPDGGHEWGILLWVLVPIASIGITCGALRNVFSDTVEVGRMATAKACAEHDAPCRVQMRHWERSAFAQTFQMHTPSGNIVVRCQREYYFAGDYRCMLRDPEIPTITAEPPAPAGAPQPPNPLAGIGDKLR
jgi:hypothetical protein